jgi:hypothetical protein
VRARRAERRASLLRCSHFAHSPPTCTCAYRTSANHFLRSHRASRFALCIALRASHVTSRSALYCACFMQTRAPDSRRHLRRKLIVPATEFFVMHDDASSSSSPSHHFHSRKLVRVPLVCGVPAEVRAELARRLSVVASSDARCVAHAGKCCLCERLSSPVLDEDDDGAVLAIAFDHPWALVGAALCETDTRRPPKPQTTRNRTHNQRCNYGRAATAHVARGREAVENDMRRSFSQLPDGAIARGRL